MRVVKLAWAEPASRFTAPFERLAIDWLKAASQGAAAEHAGVAGAHTASEADPGPKECRAGNTRVARRPVIALNASVVVELLTNGALADFIRTDLAGCDESFIVPHLLDIEVVSAIRRLVAGRRTDAHRSEQFLTGLAALPRSAIRTHR